MPADLNTLLVAFLQSLVNGTVGTTTTPLTFLSADGTQGAPSLAFASDPGTGFFSGGASILQWSVGGVARGRLNATEVKTIATVGMTWAPAGNLGTAADLGISRGAPGILAVGTGAIGNATGTVSAATFQAGGTNGVATFGPAGVVSITVKGGLVVAIS